MRGGYPRRLAVEVAGLEWNFFAMPGNGQKH